MVTRAELNALIKPITVKTEVTLDVKPIARTRTNRKDYSGNGHWIFEEEIGQSGAIGFIYCIRDCVHDRSYIGKKHFLGHGKQNRGVVSNWQWYVSSSKELAAKIHEYGKENFEFIVLEEYHTRGGLSYAETWSLMHAETPYYRTDWYNLLCQKVSWVSKEKITERHRRRLDLIIKKEAFPVQEIYGV
jgi:hypothetical protein